MEKTRIGIVGTGWRACFFLRAAKMLPELFEVVGIAYHSESSREKAAQWGYPLFDSYVKLAQEAAAETAENYHVILGRVASGDKFIGTKEGKEHIKRYVQGDCAEMEGAAIAHACWLNRIPFVIIRAISDSADEQANMSYEQFVLLAAKRSSELVEKILEKLA